MWRRQRRKKKKKREKERARERKERKTFPPLSQLATSSPPNVANLERDFLQVQLRPSSPAAEGPLNENLDLEWIWEAGPASELGALAG